MNLDTVATFVAIVDCGGFRAAAQQRCISQPAVSQQLRRLETELGVALIDRRSAAPTQAGRSFLSHARALLAMSRQAVHAVAPRALVVGASGNIGSYLLPHYLKAYADAAIAAPAPVEVHLSPNPELVTALEHGLVDLALMEWWSGRAGFTARAFRREPLVVIVPPAHPWARLGSLPVERLGEAALIGGEPGTGTGRILRELLDPARGALNLRCTVGSTEAVKQAVKAGLGVSLVFASAVRDECAAGTLVALPLAGCVLEKTLWAVTREHLPETAPAARFRTMLAA